MLINALSLDVVTSRAEVIANSGAPGARPTLEAILRHWAALDPEAARNGALALTNPLRRQHGLAAALAASADNGSESWALALQQLSPVLRVEAVEAALHGDDWEEQIAIINRRLK